MTEPRRSSMRSRQRARSKRRTSLFGNALAREVDESLIIQGSRFRTRSSASDNAADKSVTTRKRPRSISPGSAVRASRGACRSLSNGSSADGSDLRPVKRARSSPSKYRASQPEARSETITAAATTTTIPATVTVAVRAKVTLAKRARSEAAKQAQLTRALRDFFTATNPLEQLLLLLQQKQATPLQLTPSAPTILAAISLTDGGEPCHRSLSLESPPPSLSPCSSASEDSIETTIHQLQANNEQEYEISATSMDIVNALVSAVHPLSAPPPITEFQCDTDITDNALALKIAHAIIPPPAPFTLPADWLPRDDLPVKLYTTITSNRRRLKTHTGRKSKLWEGDDGENAACQCQLRPLAEEQHIQQMKDSGKTAYNNDSDAKPAVYNCSEGCLNEMLQVECTDRNCNLNDPVLCKNRKFQLGDRGLAAAFRTDLKGWGLLAATDIPPNEFVLEYVGEVIHREEVARRIAKEEERVNRCLEAREHAANSGQRKSKLLAESIIPSYYFMTVTEDIIIDAKHKGNAARFINHSCNPNCVIQKWSVDGEYRVAIFSGGKPIQRGTELTIDYQYDRINLERQPCYCGEPNCAQWIGGEKKIISKPLSKTERAKVKKLSAAEQQRLEWQSLDDVCARCGEPGDVIMCDSKCNGYRCPRCYHPRCVGMDSHPRYSWWCPWHQCHGIVHCDGSDDSDADNNRGSVESENVICRKRARTLCVTCDMSWCKDCYTDPTIQASCIPITQSPLQSILVNGRRPWLVLPESGEDAGTSTSTSLTFVVCQSCSDREVGPMTLTEDEQNEYQSAICADDGEDDSEEKLDGSIDDSDIVSGVHGGGSVSCTRTSQSSTA